MNNEPRPDHSAQRVADKFWLKAYPRNTPSEIDVSGIPTLKWMCESACARYGNSTSFVQAERSLTFAELERSSRSFGSWLQRSGMKKGDRVALMLPNILEYPVALFGALRTGMVVVNLNPLYAAREIEQLLSDSEPVVLVTLAACTQVACSSRRNLRYIVTIGSEEVPAGLGAETSIHSRCRHIPWVQAVNSQAEPSLEQENVEPEDLAFIQYTGGTTGSPKGVMLTHGNLCANILQSVAWIHAYTDTQRTLVTLLPLYHIFALEGSLLLFTHLGWQNVLVADPRNTAAVVAELTRHPIAFLSGVNTLFKLLLNTPAFTSVDFSHLQITLSGGMATEPAVAKRWNEVTGCPITQAWGLTETSPGACINLPGLPFSEALGLPIPSTQIAIKDEMGRDLPVGEVGEICVRGPQVMKGYWRRPEESARAFWPGGWLRSGDAGRFDERGFLYLVERLKDVIVVSGFKVYPQEVEAAAATCPGVREVAAAAQPDEHSGESVALFVVCGDTTIREADLIHHCRQTLAPYKVPKHIYFRSELPKSAVGKILRRVLRDELDKTRLE